MCGLVFFGDTEKNQWHTKRHIDILIGILVILYLLGHIFAFVVQRPSVCTWIFTAWLTYATIVQSHYFIGNAQNSVSVITKRLSASNIMCVSVMATKNTHNIPTDEVIFYSLFRPNIVEWLYALGIHNWHLSGSKIRHMYTPLLIYNLSILLWPILALA